ncbi:MAG: recombinase family protein [Actinomycetota bacterium]
MSLRKIAEALTAEGTPTAMGKAWHASTVKAVLESVTLRRALQETEGLGSVTPTAFG